MAKQEWLHRNTEDEKLFLILPYKYSEDGKKLSYLTLRTYVSLSPFLLCSAPLIVYLSNFMWGI